MTDCDLLLTNARIATLASDAPGYGVIDRGSVAVRNGRIAAVGRDEDMAGFRARALSDLAGRWLTPGFIDCHTHLVFAGNRADEFERRLEGASYADIAAAGGGIRSTVKATRAADESSLVDSAGQRLARLRQDGVTTVEIKSGYGLDTETELRMLRAARRLAAQTGVGVRTTLLGAHALPPEFAQRPGDYIDYVANEMLPAAVEAGVVDAVDAYCEHVAFSAEQLRPLLDRARDLGLPVKLHADQLSDCGGAALAAEYAALSADHLEYTNDAGVAALADAGCVAVLLPGAFLTLRETRQPPVAALRDQGVPIAVATDCNPGTSPVASLLAAMHLAAALFRLTPLECLAGVTRNAAAALGLADDRGTIEPGKRADLLAWDVEHPAELSYWLGRHRPAEIFIAGKPAAACPS